MGVVFFHASAGGHITALMLAIPNWVSAPIRHGDLGVAIFFVLSGFVIAHSLYDERATPTLVVRFLLRRSIRLDPPYWAAILLTIGLATLSAKFVAGKTAPDVSGPQLVAHVFYLQEVLRYSAISVVFWSLCQEVQFYIVFAALICAGGSSPKRTMFLITVACAASTLWPLGALSTEPWCGSFLPLWHGFLLGVGAYWAWHRPRFLPIFAAYALSIGVVATYRGNAFSLVCVTTAGLLWSTAVTDRIGTLLGWRWLQWIGAISYSLYLIHNPITGASFRVGYMLTGRSPLWEVVWLFASVAACLIAAAVLWYTVERPSTFLARAVARKRKTTSPIQSVSVQPAH